MTLTKNTTHIHGFEDYNIITIRDVCFCGTWGFSVPYKFDDSNGSYIINRNLPSKPYKEVNPIYSWLTTVKFNPELATNHKELLDTAKKVFTHPTCKLSRSMMAEKYKKSLNPFLSDAVIIPKPNYVEFSLHKYALFINESAKLIVKVYVESDGAHNHIKDASEGDSFQVLMTCNPEDSYGGRKPYTLVELLSSEFFYYGEVLYVPNSQSWAMDVLTHSIPADKIVFEDSVMESLGNETNRLDFDSLCSIMDMLNSSDEDTVSAGLKALSMMDWMHYRNSVKFILENTDNKYNWVYNKACNSTSVKYMMKALSGMVSKRTRWPGSYDEEIYDNDFELFKQLKCRYHHVQPDQVMNSIRDMKFMTVNAAGFMSPNFKVS